MYSVYLSNKNQSGTYDETLIFDDRYESEELSLISPTLDIESGTAGSFSATFPISNQGYSLAIPMKTEAIVRKNDKEVWRGRILNPDYDFYNQMKIDVEGELTYLTDTFQPQHEYKTETLIQVIEAVLQNHNKKVATWDATNNIWVSNANEPFDKVFYPGSCFISSTDDPTGTNVSYRKTDYNTTLDALKQIANAYKGYFIVRKENGKRYLDFLKDFNIICQQRIDFGENLLDYSKTFKMEDLCTVAMPIGGKVKDTNFTNADEMYIYLTEDNRQINYLSATDYQTKYDPSATNRHAGVVYFNEYGLHAGDKVYVCLFNRKDTRVDPADLEDGMWAFAGPYGIPSESGATHRTDQSGDYEVVDKKALEIPQGCDRLRVAWCDSADFSPKVYKQKAESGLDEHFTIAPYGEVDNENFKHTPGDIYLIYKPLYEKYGWHEKKLDFDNLEKADDLWNMATYWLTNTQFEQMTLSVTALDLSMLDVSYDGIWINMNVPIYSAPHGLTDTTFSLPCTKMSIKLGSPDNTEYTLGYSTPAEITNTESNINTNIEQLMNQVPTISSTFKAIQENSTQIINTMASVGTVTFLHDRQDHPEQITGILIANNPDPDLATEQWLWDAGGFGYRKRNQGQSWDNVQFDTAITMDGTILGKFIAAQSLSADSIWGGTLKLGHVPYTNPVTHQTTYLDGDLEVVNSNGSRIIKIEKDWGVTQDGPNAYVRLRDGMIIGAGFGVSQADGFAIQAPDGSSEMVSAVINYNMVFDGTMGMHIRTKKFGINTGAIYICEGFDGSDIQTGYTGTITVDNKDLRFICGLLVSVTQNNGGV